MLKNVIAVTYLLLATLVLVQAQSAPAPTMNPERIAQIKNQIQHVDSLAVADRSKRTILTDKAPKPAQGVYSQAIKIGKMLFLAGQIGQTPDGKLADGGTVGQMNQAFANIEAVLAAADYTLNDVVKVTVFLKDMNDFAAMNTAYAAVFKRANVQAPPARTTVEVARIPRDASIEIEAIAVKQ